MYNPNLRYVKSNLNNITIYGIQDTMTNFTAASMSYLVSPVLRSCAAH